jgi:hypothetical protein
MFATKVIKKLSSLKSLDRLFSGQVPFKNLNFKNIIYSGFVGGGERFWDEPRSLYILGKPSTTEPHCSSGGY